MSSCWPGAISARVAALSSSAAPLPSTSRLGVDAVALGQRVAQLGAAQVGVVVQAAARHEGDRVDDPRVRQLGPGRVREVERLDFRQRFAAALGRLLAQARVDLLLGHPFELLVVVEQPHTASF